MPTLNVAIDARGAVTGATTFKLSTKTVKDEAKAAETATKAMNQEIKKTGEESEKAAKKVQTLAEKVKEHRLEQRKSGEMALQRAFRDPLDMVEAMFPKVGNIGLAAFGIEFGAGQLDKMALKMQEIQKLSAEGKVSTGEMVDKWAECVPILGEVWKAGRDIHEVIAGTKLEEERLKQELEALNKLYEAQLEVVEATKKEHEQINKFIKERLAAAQQAQEGDPFERALKAAENKRETLTEALNSTLKSGKKEQQAAIAKDIEAAQTVLDQSIREFEDTWGKGSYYSRNSSTIATLGAYHGVEGTDFDAAEADRQMAVERAAVEAREKALNDIKQKYGKLELDQAQQRRDALDAIDKEVVGDVEKAMRERHDRENKEIDEATKKKTEAETKSLEATEKMMAERRKTELEMISSLEDAQADYAKSQLELQGDTLGAQLQGIKDFYAKKMEAAKSDAEYMTLLRTRDNELAIAQNKAEMERLKDVEQMMKERRKEQLDAIDDELKARKKAAEEEEKARKQHEQDVAAVQSYYDALKQEAIELELTDNEREVYVKTMELERTAKEHNIQLTQQEIDAYQDLIKELQVDREFHAITTTIGQDFGDMFTNIITGARSAQQAILDLAQSIQRLIVQEMVAKPIAGIITSGLNGLGGMFTAGGGLAGGGVTTANPGALSGVHAIANGAVFSMGNIVPFANGGVYDKPTFFPMAGGHTGVMGEAGPETVLPLDRDSRGKLGVRGGQSIVINITTPNADSFRKSMKQVAAEAKAAMR